MCIRDRNNVTQVEAASLVKKGKVNTKKLNIRVKKSMKSKRITVLHKGDRVKLLSNNSKWVAVEVNGMVGYTPVSYTHLQMNHGFLTEM